MRGRPSWRANLGAGGKREKVVRSLGVACGGERNGAKGTRTWSVGRFNVLEDLGICSEFNLHGGKIGKAGAGHDGSGAESGRSPVRVSFAPPSLVSLAAFTLALSAPHSFGRLSSTIRSAKM